MSDQCFQLLICWIMTWLSYIFLLVKKTGSTTISTKIWTIIRFDYLFFLNGRNVGILISSAYVHNILLQLYSNCSVHIMLIVWYALRLRNCYISLSSIFITHVIKYMCFLNSLNIFYNFLTLNCQAYVYCLPFHLLCNDDNKVMMLFWGLII